MLDLDAHTRFADATAELMRSCAVAAAQTMTASAFQGLTLWSDLLRRPEQRPAPQAIRATTTNPFEVFWRFTPADWMPKPAPGRTAIGCRVQRRVSAGRRMPPGRRSAIGRPGAASTGQRGQANRHRRSRSPWRKPRRAPPSAWHRQRPTPATGQQGGMRWRRSSCPAPIRWPPDSRPPISPSRRCTPCSAHGAPCWAHSVVLTTQVLSPSKHGIAGPIRPSTSSGLRLDDRPAHCASTTCRQPSSSIRACSCNRPCAPCQST